MKKSVVAFASLVVLSAAPAVIAWDHAHAPGAGSQAHTPGPSMAVAVLQPKSGSQVSGTVTFSLQGNQVVVVADVRGLPPNTTHGFHIHEKGDCSAPDGMSAGGHFNPGGHQHAGPG